MSRISPSLALPSALAVLVLSGCAAVGPNYPGAPAVADSAVKAQTFARQPAQGVASGPVAAAWWTSLGDAQLNALIEQSLKNSPDLRAIQARLRQSRAALEMQDAKRLPTVSATVAGVDLRTAPGTVQEQTLHFYTAGFLASWEVDLFGGTRRAIEAAGAESDAVEAQVGDAQVSLAAEVAQTYVDLRAQQQRREWARRVVQLDEQSLALMRQRQQQGVSSALDVERQVSQLEAARQALTQLEGAISVSLDQLALLSGQAPGALDAQLAATAELPALPQTVAVGDPTALLQHRPDVRAAERRLASSTAQIGEKKAGYFPKLSLYGDIGFNANNPAHLAKRESVMLLAAPYLSWNVLDFGRVAADVRQAEGGRDEAQAKYESSVLQALRDANTALSRYGHQREAVLSLQEQEASAQRAATLTQQRREAGAASQLDLCDARRTLADASQGAVTGRAELIKDFVVLQKSLGLGWQAVQQ